jgi:hypothetical protein
MGGYYNGDDWRWNVNKHRTPTIHTINVYELAESPPEKPDAKKVPFGFSPRDEVAPEEKPATVIDWLEVGP